MKNKIILCFLFFLATLVLQSEVINPGGAGVLGTVNYITGNLALASNVNARGGSTTSSIDGVDPVYIWGASATGGNDGAGQNLAWSASYSWHIDALNKAATSPYFFRVNFGNLASAPNAGNQEYAISRINVYGRTEGWGTQFRGDVHIFNLAGTNVATRYVVGDSTVQSLEYFTYGTLGMIGRGIDYRNMISFNEIEAYGMSNLSLSSTDSINIEWSNQGNDYLYVQGAAVLNGQINISTLNGYIPTSQPINIMTASSINATNLTLSQGYYYSIVSGGNGQILQVGVIPELNSFVFLFVFSLFMLIKRIIKY